MAQRPRCTECRKRFTPALTTGDRQKTCGPECRLARRRKQSRARRRRDDDDYRAAERARQGVHREKQQEQLGGSGCHAPASAAIPLELRDKVHQIVDEAARLSRAGFDRGVREILRELGETWAITGRRHAPASPHKPP
jgi:hypothetical protein